MSPTRPMTVRVTPEEEEVVKRLSAELDVSISDVFRRALAVVAGDGEELIAREQSELKQGAELLERIRAAGHLKDDEAIAGHPISVEVRTSRRVIVKWAGHVFQDIGGRLVVARLSSTREPEIAYLDGPEPPEPDVQKFIAERVLI